ncbi:MAG TPA: trehalose-phosphatase [Dermatophilaceae bacterium]|jgi:trehalose 6-phosphate phosphatase|nr:trehalose-phosphatase [Dermatophilaceae bacterium]
MTESGTDLRRALAAFAARPRVLVAVDFDGTLSPFVLDPMQARAVPGGVEALRAAAALAGVNVAVVSGRDLATLEAITGIGRDDGVTLIGSHGAQTNLGDPNNLDNLDPALDADFLDEDATAMLRVVSGELKAIKSRYPAVRLEYKPSAVALHTRGVEPSVATAATAAAREVGERYPAVHVMPGKNVVELTVLEANKGIALTRLARATNSDATLYLGDDVTDERAFGALDPASGDLTVKVGDGETVAAQRVPDQESVVELLELFAELRRARG